MNNEPRDLLHNVTGRLFQAAMWRRHAMDWDKPYMHSARLWVEHVLKISRDECMRRARINLRLAKRLNKRRILNTENTLGGNHE